MDTTDINSDEGFGDGTETERTEDGRPVIRHVVKDLSSAVKMKRVQAESEARARRAEAKTELQRARIDAREARAHVRADIAKMRMGMSAREAASKNIAIWGPLYLLILIGAFLAVLGLDVIPEDAVSTVATLLTLLITMIGSNLRSIVSGNGDDAKKKKGVPPLEKGYS